MICWKTLLTVSITFLGIVLAYRGVKKSLKINTTLKLDERFTSMEFRQIRKKAVYEILEFIPDKKFESIFILDEVLDFFEQIAYFIDKRVIDKDIAINMFSWWLERYYFLSEGYIKNERLKDPHRWEYLVNFYGRKPFKMSDDNKEEFIRAEKNVLIYLDE